MTELLLLIVRRRECGCVVAAAVAGTQPAAELGRVFGRDRRWRLLWRAAPEITISRCTHGTERRHLRVTTPPQEIPA